MGKTLYIKGGFTTHQVYDLILDSMLDGNPVDTYAINCSLCVAGVLEDAIAQYVVPPYVPPVIPPTTARVVGSTSIVSVPMVRKKPTALLASASSIVPVPTQPKFGAAALYCDSTITINNVRLIKTTASLTSVSTITSNNDVFKKSSASLTSSSTCGNPYLLDAMNKNYETRISGGSTSNWFSTYTFGDPPTITLDANCWAAGLDTTPLVVMNNNWLYFAKMGGCAITRKHLAMAIHFNIGVGAKLWFRLTDGSFIYRNIVRFGLKSDTGVHVTNDPYFYVNNRINDILIVELDSELPVDITICKILPTTITNYLAGWDMPLILAAKRPIESPPAYTRYLFATRAINITSTSAIFFSASSNTSPFSLVTGDWQNHDSGCPAITHIGSQVIFLATAQGINSGPNYSYWHVEIQEILDALGGGYSITFADLSGYKPL